MAAGRWRAAIALLAGASAVAACRLIAGVDTIPDLADANVGPHEEGGAKETASRHDAGRDAGHDDARTDGKTQGGHDSGADHAAACGPNNCQGCCDPASGKCVQAAGASTTCGFGGNACATCTGSAACTSGVCLGCSAPTVIVADAAMDPNLNGGANFGSSVAISGDTLLLGASATSSYIGSAYFFQQSGGAWNLVASLNGSVAGGPTVTNFGEYVAVSGSTAMISALVGTTPAVFVYTQTGSNWFYSTTIFVGNVDSSESSAPALALDGDTVVIGSTLYPGNAVVYVLSGNKWTLQGALTPSESIPGITSGFVVGLSGDTAIVGVSATNTSGSQARWADIFVRNGTTWSQQGPSLAPAGIQANNSPHFSFSVGVSGDTAVLAATPGAFVYQRVGSVWTQDAPVLPDAGVNFAPDANPAFGSAVAVTSGAMVAGASYGYNGGASYLYALSSNGWIGEALPLFDAGAGGPLSFGVAVARSGSLVVVGAPGDTANVGAGAVCIYTCSP